MLGTLFNFLFIKIIYRPFFNVLILIYQLLPWGPDMGLALIIFTIFINICLLPLSMREDQNAPEKEELLHELKLIEQQYRGYPLLIKKERQRLIRQHRRIIWSRLFSYAIYVLYFIILYRVFKTGIKGRDLKLLYSFVPQPKQPLNTNFLGVLELTQPSPLLNTISAIFTIPAELLSIMFSPLPPTREDWLGVFLAPIVAFVITYRIPSGQELFFTISLIFIIIVLLTRQFLRVFLPSLTGK